MDQDTKVVENVTALIQSLSKKEIDRLRKIFNPDPNRESIFTRQVGNNVFIRTVTYHCVGTVVGSTEDAIILDPCVWIGDSGKWNDCLVKGQLADYEDFPGENWVMRQSIVDACPWDHPVPLRNPDTNRRKS